MKLAAPRSTTPIVLVTMLAAAALQPGCDDGGATTPESVDEPGGTEDGGGSPGVAGGTKPLFALGIETVSLAGGTSYVTFLDSLDAQADVTLAQAREFPNYAPVTAAGGKLFVNSGEAPLISRYAVGDDKSWTDDGSVSFAGYASGPLSQSIQFSDTLAYAPADAATFVQWNPTTFALGAVATLPPQLVPASLGDGFVLNRGYATLIAGDLAYQSFYYATTQWQFHGTSYVGILDSTSHRWTSAIQVGCPHLHVGSADDRGGLYFSPGQGSVIMAEMQATAPRNCMVRVEAGKTAVDGEPIYFKDLAEGREGSNFFYVGDGVGFFNVYHREMASPSELQSPQLLALSTNYHLWTLDLHTMTAKPMEGIDFGGGQYQAFRFDDRVFIALPGAGYGSTTIYEVTKDGRAERRFTSESWVYNIVKVR